jgi:AcrR family transcriptional regulator
MQDSPDKRVVKTKKSIRDALMALLRDKPIGQISVKELSEAANINRKTFYSHYATIEDVIAELEDELAENVGYFLHNALMGDENLGPQHLIQFVNLVYTSNPAFFENLLSTRNYAFLAQKIKAVFRREILNCFSDRVGDPQRLSYLTEFALGGISSVYVEWIRSGKQVPFEEVNRLLLSMVPDWGAFLGLTPAHRPIPDKETKEIN